MFSTSSISNTCLKVFSIQSLTQTEKKILLVIIILLQTGKKFSRGAVHSIYCNASRDAGVFDATIIF